MRIPDEDKARRLRRAFSLPRFTPPPVLY